MQINCESPQIIVNPLINELVAMYGNYTLFGYEYKFKSPKRLLYEFQAKDIKLRLSDCTLDNLDCSYVTDYSSGETYPVYIQVPCGHCTLCRQAKVNAFVDRCKLETQLYNSQPIFLTLTYNEKNLPKNGVCLRDVQLFFKRLRINLYRQGYRESIRYALVSEYGKRCRPHYHAILWNLHQSDICSYFTIGEIIRKSWNKGFEMHRLINPADDKAFRYTSKYLYKGSNIPDGKNKTFLVCSNRGGAIGAAFVDRLRKKAVKLLNTDIKYVNKWSGRVEHIQLNRYVLNRLVPSLSRSLPYSLKCRVRRFIYDYSILDKRLNPNVCLFDDKFRLIYQFFSKYFYLYAYGNSFPVEIDLKRTDEQILKEMLQDEIYISDALSKGDKYYEDAVYYSDMRLPYLTKIFAHVTEQNLTIKSYNARKLQAAALERQIL